MPKKIHTIRSYSIQRGNAFKGQPTNIIGVPQWVVDSYPSGQPFQVQKTKKGILYAPVNKEWKVNY